MKTTIHTTPREILARELPGLQFCGPDMWSLAGMLLFSPWIDEETGAIRVGAEVLARTVGKNHLVLLDTETGKKSAPNFKAKTVLDVFINYVMPEGSCELLDYVAPSNDNPGMQRRLIVRWPDAIKNAIEDELTGKYDNEERVYIKDGSKVSYRKQKALLDADKMEAANINEIIATPVSKSWTSYLNSLPTNLFSSMLRNYDVAREEAMKISNPHSRLIALKQLDIIREQPLPIYKTTPRTTRIYSMTASLQNLPKNLRRILMQGHTEFDLHHAQLAIVAKIWNIPTVDAFLSSGRSLWKELVAHMGLTNLSPETYEEVKWILKRYTYSTTFGMTETNLTKGNVARIARLKKLRIKTAAKKVSGLDSDLAFYGVENAGEKFTTFPLMADLLAARNRMLAYLSTPDAGLPNAFGELVKVKPGFDERDVLAQVAQSYEMFLLNPVLNFAKQNAPYMTVSLFSHDGFNIKFHNNDYKERLIKCVLDGVNEWCKKSGFNTWLEYEEIPFLATQPTHIQADLVDAALTQERSLPEATVEVSKEEVEQDLTLTFTKVSKLTDAEIEATMLRLEIARDRDTNKLPYNSILSLLVSQTIIRNLHLQ